ncbi:ATP synthase protein I-like membrane protein [hydrothermal vent metagenome]|uniref:ATP synthase protein I-like membrane protein n=1 Tax=hydrothermal vent metagenome TaxID=652676 RepID=A0A1W1B8K9_9ZZZZ
MNENDPKLKKVVDAADGLSLGISIVVAVLLGVGLGLLMRNFFGYGWLLWLGVFWGVSAAILNVYKAYKKQKASLDELANDPRYSHRRYEEDDDDED